MLNLYTDDPEFNDLENHGDGYLSSSDDDDGHDFLFGGDWDRTRTIIQTWNKDFLSKYYFRKMCVFNIACAVSNIDCPKWKVDRFEKTIKLSAVGFKHAPTLPPLPISPPFCFSRNKTSDKETPTLHLTNRCREPTSCLSQITIDYLVPSESIGEKNTRSQTHYPQYL